LRVVTLVVDRLEVPVTFKLVPKTDGTLSVAILDVKTLEFPVTLRVVAKRPAAFITRALALVETLRAAMLARV
jgi:hypothetical protein